MSFFCIIAILQSSKKAYSIQRDIPASFVEGGQEIVVASRRLADTL